MITRFSFSGYPKIWVIGSYIFQLNIFKLNYFNYILLLATYYYTWYKLYCSFMNNNTNLTKLPKITDIWILKNLYIFFKHYNNLLYIASTWVSRRFCGLGQQLFKCPIFLIFTMSNEHVETFFVRSSASRMIGKLNEKKNR